MNPLSSQIEYALSLRHWKSKGQNLEYSFWLFEVLCGFVGQTASLSSAN